MGVDLDGDTTGDCDTKGGDGTCAVPAGSTFTLEVSLNSLGGVAEYEAFDLYVTYTGVSSKDDAAAAWPDCAFPFSFTQPGEVGWGCAIGPGADPSTHTGLIGTNDFRLVEREDTSVP